MGSSMRSDGAPRKQKFFRHVFRLERDTPRGPARFAVEIRKIRHPDLNPSKSEMRFTVVL